MKKSTLFWTALVLALICIVACLMFTLIFFTTNDSEAGAYGLFSALLAALCFFLANVALNQHD